MRFLNTNKRAQSTAEYAVVIAIVLAAAVGMQTYVKRALQARIHGATNALLNVQGDAGNGIALGNLKQYEPYTADSTYNVNRQDVYTENMNAGSMTYNGAFSNTIRTGSQRDSITGNGFKSTTD